MTAEQLKNQLVELRIEHEDLDSAIRGLIESGSYNDAQIQRLKKRKLAVKDAITKIQVRLDPDDAA